MRLSVAAAISHGRVYRRLGLGPESRIHLLRNLLTGLVRHERIEASWARVDEMRGYAEKVRGGIPLGSTARVWPEGAEAGGTWGRSGTSVVSPGPKSESFSGVSGAHSLLWPLQWKTVRAVGLGAP